MLTPTTANPFAAGLRDALRPRERLPLSAWAEKHVTLSAERSASPGPFRIGDAAYQRGMLDTIGDPDVAEVVLMTSSQVGKTSMLSIVQAYYAEAEPSPQLHAQPTNILAEAYKVETFEPLFRDSASLKGLLRTGGKQTKDFSAYPGGYIVFVGANNPHNLAMRPIRVVTGDELDRWPMSSGKEGSPVQLARKRTATFRNRKLVWASTPVLEDYSAITGMFANSDQRRFHVPCADCGDKQHLVWDNVIVRKGAENDARYCCNACGSLWDEHAKRKAVKGGEWVAMAPGAATVGFHVNELYSPWSSMAAMAKTFHEAEGDPTRLQTFWNTALGLPYKGDIGAHADAAMLAERLEDFPANRVPANAGIVTCGVDVQDDRLELMYVAWGKGDESWLLDHVVIRGDPSTERVWLDLEEALMRRFTHASGKILWPEAVCIDSGGHHTGTVYQFAVKADTRGLPWLATRGVAGEGRNIIERSKMREKSRVKLYLVGVDGAKATIYQRYGVTKPGSGMIHIPKRFGDNEGELLKQMTSERVMLDYVDGFPKRTWVKHRGQRNEMLDMTVYALAARAWLNVDISTRIEMLNQATPEVIDAEAIGALYR